MVLVVTRHDLRNPPHSQIDTLSQSPGLHRIVKFRLWTEVKCYCQKPVLHLNAKQRISESGIGIAVPSNTSNICFQSVAQEGKIRLEWREPNVPLVSKDIWQIAKIPITPAIELCNAWPPGGETTKTSWNSHDPFVWLKLGDILRHFVGKQRCKALQNSRNIKRY